MSSAFDVLKERGFVSQVTNEEAVAKAFEDETVTCYIGFDPTGQSLHVGNLVQIMMLAHVQRGGHLPIALVGGGTAMIPDPSGKDALRPQLSTEDIDRNILRIKKQLSSYLDFDGGHEDRAGRADRALMVNNADWLRTLNYITFLREIGEHFSVNRMLTAEAYRLRMETGLTFLEFNYQILQAYDFLMLFREYGCTMQFGGDDQWGNIVAGVDLIRRKERAAAQAITTPLLTLSDGKKMGKTAEGAVWLDPGMTSPYDFYQFWINVDDRDVEGLLGHFTFLPMEQVRELGALEGEKIRHAKSVLAFETTKITHGEEAASQAERGARSVFGGAQAGAEDVPTVEIGRERLEAGINVVDLFVEAELGKSKSEVRRLIQQGGASVNGERVAAIDRMLGTGDLDDEGVLLLRAGKKRFQRVKTG
ncbi:MAG: tyrosine--tRNA ligase [Gemmatimonadetes bacterium]|nr:tyrosine--tRNA ligase [Gemmatimonadota bacterium]MYG83753.1 tyrosine--tRNA ligase [Gemmatimonadota bacterium]MYJ90412.1 tyrosine--tRNA ligase [Gemmatimonadota bacterium]